MRTRFEREFFQLAAVALGAQLVVMGGEVEDGPAGDMAFHCLGIMDYCGEMRLLCGEVLGTTRGSTGRG